MKYIVVVKIETDAPLVFTFSEDRKEDAENLYNRYRLNWSDVYLCEVKEGPVL